MCVFYFLYQKNDLYFSIRNSDLDQRTLRTHSDPGPSLLASYYVAPLDEGAATVEMFRILYINWET